MSADNIPPCPWCKSRDMHVSDTDFKWQRGFEKRYRVRCRYCEATGPVHIRMNGQSPEYAHAAAIKKFTDCYPGATPSAAKEDNGRR